MAQAPVAFYLVSNGLKTLSSVSKVGTCAVSHLLKAFSTDIRNSVKGSPLLFCITSSGSI